MALRANIHQTSHKVILYNVITNLLTVMSSQEDIFIDFSFFIFYILLYEIIHIFKKNLFYYYYFFFVLSGSLSPLVSRGGLNMNQLFGVQLEVG